MQAPTLQVVARIQCRCKRTDDEPVWVRIRLDSRGHKTGISYTKKEPCWNCRRTIELSASSPTRVSAKVEVTAGSKDMQDVQQQQLQVEYAQFVHPTEHGRGPKRSR